MKDTCYQFKSGNFETHVQTDVFAGANPYGTLGEGMFSYTARFGVIRRESNVRR